MFPKFLSFIVNRTGRKNPSWITSPEMRIAALTNTNLLSPYVFTWDSLCTMSY
jgi:hypothetical protein